MFRSPRCSAWTSDKRVSLFLIHACGTLIGARAAAGPKQRDRRIGETATGKTTGTTLTLVADAALLPRGGPDECVNHIHVLHHENACAHRRQQVGVSTDRTAERNGCSPEEAWRNVR
ncbi:hypothetical protein ALC60_11904 [Trachymyrmex zeteki]|uniref:Uncharacterized protein n=1 Tax=Mycetomoellerius zeteki TaxID=64791 RepID=A0A151WLT3_9HYME|nr:hypothetical protein ALC60_11904 [Trachymyrmex zeteki]